MSYQSMLYWNPTISVSIHHWYKNICYLGWWPLVTTPNSKHPCINDWPCFPPGVVALCRLWLQWSPLRLCFVRPRLTLGCSTKQTHPPWSGVQPRFSPQLAILLGRKLCFAAQSRWATCEQQWENTVKMLHKGPHMLMLCFNQVKST